MTEMRRISIALPDELDAEIYKLRSDERYARLTYSELVRRLIIDGIRIATGTYSQEQQEN